MKCPSILNARSASHHRIASTKIARYSAYRWMFWRMKGKRVSPLYFARASGIVHAGGAQKKAR